MVSRNKTEKSFQQLAKAEEAVKPLKAKYNLEIVKRKTGEYGEELTLQNAVAGVRIRHSLRDGKGLLVVVGQLDDGRFPPHPGPIHEGTVLTRFDLRDIASLRMDRISESLQNKLRADVPIDGEDVAKLLSHCCADILSGDFSIFGAASRIVKARAERLAREYSTTKKES
jgi:hypothetical protein